MNRSLMHGRRAYKAERALLAEGWERTGADFPGDLWELDRGCRMDHRIVAVMISPTGKAILFKTAKQTTAD